MADMINKKRARDDSNESDLGSPEVKKIRDDLLDLLDDSDVCTTSQDLDSFMKSFEEEIKATSAPPSAESQLELGYLLEASDDQLGLPPSSENYDVYDPSRVSSDSSGLTELWGFDQEISGYDSFGVGGLFGDGEGSEYVALDGLFDHSDLGFWRSETLPAQ